MQSAMHSVKLI